MDRFQRKIKKLMADVHVLENSADKEANRIPSDCYFLDEDTVLAYKRSRGDGRYPYSYDGRTLWAYSSGNLSVEESLYNVFLDAREGKEPFLCFFAGRKEAEGYFPISLLGVARQPIEKDIRRYTVFTPQAVYYFTEAKELTACVRAFIDDCKRICFSVYIENTSNQDLETYVSSYFNPFMRHDGAEGFENKWYKECVTTDYGYRFRVTEYVSRTNCLTHYASLCVSGAENAYTTTSRFEYTGGANESLNCAISLINGRFEAGKDYTCFTDVAIAGDVVPLWLKKGESHRQDYVFAVENDLSVCESLATKDENLSVAMDGFIKKAEQAALTAEAKMLGLRFAGLQGELQGRDKIFNYFLRNVLRQVEFCTRAKNYAGAFIGIRDIFQQVESAIAWIPEYCRKKIVEALNFIGEDGRPPRQYSYPPNEKTLPQMDLRPFIDQGLWIISTVYTYLSYTDDYSILDEECGYYKFVGNSVEFCDKRNSVLEHLLTITDFLLSNIDTETGCLRALYGDWNDALDGLGKTDKENQEYGNGVSVMASEQLYRSLGEMAEICAKIGGLDNKAKEYLFARVSLKNALIQHAIVSDGASCKILHGWGDDKSFFVGSYQDNDGYNRDGLTANAYWILSGLHHEYPLILPEILNAYKRLDSKYGLKTFEPYFPPENDKVGRINRLPKGTAENGATYIHATLFAVWSLFEIGEAKLAWKQVCKILPITHEFISTTPFVMPNSYLYNTEKGFDGESMSDWFTGSGCVLIKSLIGGAFGVRPTLDGVSISTAEYMPCKEADISLKLKGSLVHLSYRDKGNGNRKYFVNGEEMVAEEDGIFLSSKQLSGTEYKIEIVD